MPNPSSEKVCVSTSHDIYEGPKLKGDQWGRLEELQIDRIALQKDIPANQIEEKDTSKGSHAYNGGQLERPQYRWGAIRFEGEADMENDPCWSTRSGER